MMTDRKSLNNKVVVPAAVVAMLAVAMVGVIVLSPMSVLAQNSTNTTTNNNALTAPNINGSVSIRNATNDFVKNNVRVSFTDAANTAKGQVPNGVIVGGRLSDVQGFLAYTFSIANYDAGTMKIVIVDAGNGQVLYTSNDLPLNNGGIGGACLGSAGWSGMHHHGLGMYLKNPNNGMTPSRSINGIAGITSA
jgi:uncharacterized membrane protein YkoI